LQLLVTTQETLDGSPPLVRSLSAAREDSGSGRGEGKGKWSINMKKERKKRKKEKRKEGRWSDLAGAGV